MRSLVLLLVAATAGCGADEPGSAGGDGPTVVVTHSLLADMVDNVVGEEAQVELIMPPGADPHDFEPSAAQVALVTEADLVVANGLGFEVGLADALDGAEADGARVLELGPELDPLPLDGEGEGQDDPHWFTDPLRMADAAGLVAEAVGEIDGVDAVVVTGRADGYAAEIRAIHTEIEVDLSAIAPDDRTLVTNHEVFGYFADRYDFEVVGTVIPSGTTLAEPSSADLSDLGDTIEEAGVSAIFADTSSSAELAEVLADETGEDIEVVELFSESLGEAGSGGETYLDLIRTNAERIVDALA